MLMYNGYMENIQDMIYFPDFKMRLFPVLKYLLNQDGLTIAHVRTELTAFFSFLMVLKIMTHLKSSKIFSTLGSTYYDTPNC